MTINFKVTFKLYPYQVAGLVSAVRRGSQEPPLAGLYPSQVDYMAALTAYAVLIEHDRKLRCSSTIDRWREKVTGRLYAYSLQTPVAMALWWYLRQTGPRTDAEQSFFNQLDRELVNGHLLRPAAPAPLTATRLNWP